MCDVRDTLILPCRHLCLCNGCADSLRYQANNCPICRAPFRALLQIKALQKATGAVITNPPLPEVRAWFENYLKKLEIHICENLWSTQSNLREKQHWSQSWPISAWNNGIVIFLQGSSENIPAGYEAVSLIEALNGPCTPRAAVIPPESPDTPDTDTASAIQAVEALNRWAECRSNIYLKIYFVLFVLVTLFHYDMIRRSAERTPVSKHSSIKESDITARSSSTPCPTPEFRMSVLLARDENGASQKDLHGRSPGMRAKTSGHQRDKSNLRTRDTLRLVNEKQPASLYEVLNDEK